VAQQGAAAKRQRIGDEELFLGGGREHLDVLQGVGLDARDMGAGRELRTVAGAARVSCPPRRPRFPEFSLCVGVEGGGVVTLAALPATVVASLTRCADS
jgi:hypothetical protein